MDYNKLGEGFEGVKPGPRSSYYWRREMSISGLKIVNVHGDILASTEGRVLNKGELKHMHLPTLQKKISINYSKMELLKRHFQA